MRNILLATALAVSAAATSDAATYDVWIRNGEVIDGTGHARVRADVLVNGDSIAYVGAVDPAKTHARRTIDAAGRVVTPGFIDTHSHGDPLQQSFTNFLEQGITTVVLGQDGFSPEIENEPHAGLAEWMRRVEQHGSEVNIATLSGHSTLRERAGVNDNPMPSAAQLGAMQKMLAEDLDAGAYGLSFGLEYAPARYSSVPEQKALGDLVGRRGGIVMSHLRSEDFDKIHEAVAELLQIDAHVHVSHLKIVAGKHAAEAQAVLDQMARARAQGKVVTGDVYSYMASASNLVFLYPDWAKRRSDYEKAVKERRPELEAHIRKRVEARNGPQAILFVDGKYAGKTLADVSKLLNKPYEKVAIDDIGYGGPEQAHFLMSPEVQGVFIKADYVSFCTDGAPGSGHPRSYDSFIKVLQDFVGAPPKMSLERAIHKMSGLPASFLGLDRGELIAGRKADVLILNPAELHTRSTWTDPKEAPSGIDTILVNGAVAYANGKPAPHGHGKMLRWAASAAQSVPSSP